jgi:hypothetical protein
MKRQTLPLLVCLAVAFASCATAEKEVAPLPGWSFAPETIVPSDGSLAQPEDGVALPDGRLLVADQAYGLRLDALTITSAEGANPPRRPIPPDRHGREEDAALPGDATDDGVDALRRLWADDVGLVISYMILPRMDGAALRQAAGVEELEIEDVEWSFGRTLGIRQRCRGGFLSSDTHHQQERVMAFVLIRHKVKEFETWKAGYDDHQPKRAEAGLTENYLLRGADDANEVVALFEAQDLDRAKEFVASADLRETMQKVRVIDKPDIYFLNR